MGLLSNQWVLQAKELKQFKHKMSDCNRHFQINGYRAPTKWIQKSTQHLLLVSSDSVRVFSDSHKDRRSKERSSVELSLWKLILRGFPNLISGFCRLSESDLAEVAEGGGVGITKHNVLWVERIQEK